MSLDRSLKSANALIRHRNVLTRDERLLRLKETEKWDEKKSVFGLPKVANRKLIVGGKAEKAEGEEGAAAAGAAAPAAGAKAGAAKGAAPAKGGAAPAKAGAAPAKGAAAPAKGAAPKAAAAAPAKGKK